MIRVLVVTIAPALPLTHGGRVRTFKLAAALARAGASVRLLCPWGPGMPLRDFESDGLRCEPHLFLTNALLALPNGLLPSVVAASWQPWRAGPSQRLASLDDVDLVQFDFCAYAAWMEHLQGVVPIVHSSHNVELDLATDELRRSWLRPPLLRRIESLERRAVQASDLVVACTEADRGRLSKLYGKVSPSVVIPNGFDESLLALDRDAARRNTRSWLGISDDEKALVFVGGRSLHNLEAVEFLERALLPRLTSKTRLILVGGSADAMSERDRRVVKAGVVQDVGPLLAAADVAVNPVELGSGSNIKLAEYLAARLPVVTTPFGARGYEGVSERVLVAERVDFPVAIHEALAMPQPSRSPEELSWERLGERLLHAYREFVGRGS